MQVTPDPDGTHDVDDPHRYMCGLVGCSSSQSSLLREIVHFESVLLQSFSYSSALLFSYSSSLHFYSTGEIDSQVRESFFFFSDSGRTVS